MSGLWALEPTSSLAAVANRLGRAGGRLAEAFAHMVRRRRADTLAAWMDTVKRERVRPLMRFAHRLEPYLQAAYKALRLPWSSGPTEGWIRKLNAIKRMMDGRAGLDLLRRRLLCCA